MPFGWRVPGRRSVPADPSFTGRRWIPTEFVNLCSPLRGGNGTGRGRRCDRCHLGGGYRGGGRYRPIRRSPGGGGSRRNSSISVPRFGGGNGTGRGRRCDRCHLGGGHRGGGRYRPIRRSPGGGGSRRNSSISVPRYGGGNGTGRGRRCDRCHLGGGYRGGGRYRPIRRSPGGGGSRRNSSISVPRFGEETAPVAGGGATGAIWVAGTGEEVGTGRSVVHREEVDPDGIRQSLVPASGEDSTGRGRRCDRC